jgi:predicted esterase
VSAMIHIYSVHLGMLPPNDDTRNIPQSYRIEQSSQHDAQLSFLTSIIIDIPKHNRRQRSVLARARLLRYGCAISFHCMWTRSLRIMASPHPVKILMLHGYTQNGPLFRAKTRVLEKRLQKAFPSVSLAYPTGQIQLKPSDVPGFDGNPTESTEAYGWWRKRDDSDPPEYVGIEDAFDEVAKVLKAEGPFDGVIGFSQGACFAAVVASLLEGDIRRKAFEEAQSKSQHAIAYPKSFADLDHPPLKFGIVYSGFIPPGSRYEAFYNPPIQTPLCHFIGSLDSVVEEARTQKLVDAAGGNDRTQVIVHPGGHFVPTSKQYLDIAAGFVEQSMRPRSEVNGAKEESAEDMDVPF